MSLIVMKTPDIVAGQTAGDLTPGTWFLDRLGQVHAVVLDDRTHEKRVVCGGDFCRPFIANAPARDFSVATVLPAGTIVQIAAVPGEGGDHDRPR